MGMQGSIHFSRLMMHQHISTSGGILFKSTRLSKERPQRGQLCKPPFSIKSKIHISLQKNVDSPDQSFQVGALLLWVLAVFLFSALYIAMEGSQILNSAAKRKAEFLSTTLRW